MASYNMPPGLNVDDIPQDEESDTTTLEICPICGEKISITGIALDGRLIGSCGDAFSLARWIETKGD